MSTNLKVQMKLNYNRPVVLHMEKTIKPRLYTPKKKNDMKFISIQGQITPSTPYLSSLIIWKPGWTFEESISYNKVKMAEEIVYTNTPMMDATDVNKWSLIKM